MSDKVKLIIEIPKVPKNDHERWVLAHGTPLDDVKSEIDKLTPWIYKSEVFGILDDIGKGSEVKPNETDN